jgi:hypothetical protein
VFFGARGARTDRVRMDNAKAPTSDGKTLSSKAVQNEEDGMKSPCAGEPAQCSHGVATAPEETCGPA